MPHLSTIIVRFADLDPYDHVNHARYLTFFESARIEALEEMGFGMNTMKDDGIQIVLVEITVVFHAPASLHDRLDISTTVGEVGGATSRWRQEARITDRLVATADVYAAFTGRDGRPRRVPKGFADAADLVAGP